MTWDQLWYHWGILCCSIYAIHLQYVWKYLLNGPSVGPMSTVPSMIIGLSKSSPFWSDFFFSITKDMVIPVWTPSSTIFPPNSTQLHSCYSSHANGGMYSITTDLHDLVVLKITLSKHYDLLHASGQIETARVVYSTIAYCTTCSIQSWTSEIRHVFDMLISMVQFKKNHIRNTCEIFFGLSKILFPKQQLICQYLTMLVARLA